MSRWTFEPGHTAAEFCVRHMMVTNVRGRFAGVRGGMEFDPQPPALARVEAVIDARGLWTGEPDRDAHLKSADFLDVDRFPEWRTPWWEDGVDRGPKTRAGFVATTRFNRHDFGVSWNSPLERGGLVVGDDVLVTLDVEAILEE
jgi:polyisoprenoid-binding protein YceI